MRGVRRFDWLAIALFGLCLTSAAGASEPLRGVVLITVDTLRADHVGVYGGTVATPAMDALAAQGAHVERAFSPVPTTGPAHASMLTGLHPWRHRVLGNAVSLGEEIVSLGEIAAKGGVLGAAFVSSYVLHERFGLARGFASVHFQPDQRYRWRGRIRENFWVRGEDTTRAAMSWLTETASARPDPFLLWIHYFDPHAPYSPPPGYAVPPDEPVDLEGRSLPSEVKSARQLRNLIRAYRGEVRYVDEQIGRVLERLHLLGLDEHTAVILTADHGEGLGDHGVLQHGVNLFDELVRVPLIVRAPGIEPGRRFTGPAQLEDLFPTTLSLLGLPTPQGIDGVDLLPWLRGESSESPRAVVVGRRKIFARESPIFFQQRGLRKWIGPIDGPGREFRLGEDPRERAGKAASGAPEPLRSRVANAGGDSGIESVPQPEGETRRALEALGYLEPSDGDERD